MLPPRPAAHSRGHERPGAENTSEKNPKFFPNPLALGGQITYITDVTQTLLILLARVAASIRTPEAARALLRFLFAPLIARMERDLAAALQTLDDMLAAWKAGNLPALPDAPQSDSARRPRTGHASTMAPACPEEPSWLTNLFALASQDQPARPETPPADAGSILPDAAPTTPATSRAAPTGRRPARHARPPIAARPRRHPLPHRAQPGAGQGAPIPPSKASCRQPRRFFQNRLAADPPRHAHIVPLSKQQSG